MKEIIVNTFLIQFFIVITKSAATWASYIKAWEDFNVKTKIIFELYIYLNISCLPKTSLRVSNALNSPHHGTKLLCAGWNPLYLIQHK
jgi:hypothetical protein